MSCVTCLICMIFSWMFNHSITFTGIRERQKVGMGRGIKCRGRRKSCSVWAVLFSHLKTREEAVLVCLLPSLSTNESLSSWTQLPVESLAMSPRSESVWMESFMPSNAYKKNGRTLHCKIDGCYFLLNYPVE